MNTSPPIRLSQPDSDVNATRVHDAMRQQVTEVIDPHATEPFGVYVWADPNPAAWLARHVERVVFEESFGNST